MNDTFETQLLPRDRVSFTRDEVPQQGFTIRNVYTPKMGTDEKGQSIKVGRGEYVGTEVETLTGHYLFQHADSLTRIAA